MPLADVKSSGQFCAEFIKPSTTWLLHIWFGCSLPFALKQARKATCHDRDNRVRISPRSRVIMSLDIGWVVSKRFLTSCIGWEQLYILCVSKMYPRKGLSAPSQARLPLPRPFLWNCIIFFRKLFPETCMHGFPWNDMFSVHLSLSFKRQKKFTTKF